MHTVDPPIIQQQPNNGDNDNQGNNDDDENEEDDDDDDNNDAELDTEVAENQSEGVPWYRAGDSVQYDAEEGDGNVEADANFENDIRDNFLTDSNYNPQEDLQYGLEEGAAQPDITTTDAGYFAKDIEQHPSMQRVTGHVLLNQVGICTSRNNQRHIQGSNAEKHFIQSFACKRPGEASPLLQIEAALFPSIFWTEATADPLAYPGALPVAKFCP